MPKLIIVESPIKARAFQSMLDSENFIVISTGGHIADLPENDLGIEIEGDSYVPRILLKESAKETVKKIKKISKTHEVVIATDDDREGERIASDLVEFCELTKYERIVFHEISQKAITDALNSPRKLNKDELEKQKARRLVDRVIGYPGSNIISHDFKTFNLQISPKGIGRSIIPALAILVETEERILEFEENPPPPNKMIVADFVIDNIAFRARHRYLFAPEHQLELSAKLRMVEDESRKKGFVVTKYDADIEEVIPPKPLTTSSYQYGAFYLFGLQPKEAMKIAQDLYYLELITYPRTDLCFVSDDRAIAIINLIAGSYGQEYAHETIRKWKNKKSTQGAHESILPMSFDEKSFPKHIRKTIGTKKHGLEITEMHYKIYRFIFYRAVATQMANAKYEVSSAHLELAGVCFEAEGREKVFDGWERLIDEIKKESDEDFSLKEDKRLPRLEIHDEFRPVEIKVVEKPRERPKRYGVGRFVSKLFALGLVRPSTMDKIVERLSEKGYTEITKAGIILPTFLGKKIIGWAQLYWSELSDIEEAKKFEEKIDQCTNADALVSEYVSQVQDRQKKRGMASIFDRQSPFPWQIEKAKEIAEANGIFLEEQFFLSRAKIEMFLRDNGALEAIGKCPVCKKSIRETEKAFGCSNYREGCKFAIWKESSLKFFSVFGVEANDVFLREIVKGLLAREDVVLSLVSPKTGKQFEAKISIRKNDRGYWEIALPPQKSQGGYKSKK